MYPSVCGSELCVHICPHQRVLEILSSIADGKIPFDMDRMQSILVMQIRRFLNKARGSPLLLLLLLHLLVIFYSKMC